MVGREPGGGRGPELERSGGRAESAAIGPRWKEKGGNGKVAARRRAKTTLMAPMEGVAYGLGDNSVNFWSLGLRLGHLAAEIPHREGVYRAGTRAAAGAV